MTGWPGRKAPPETGVLGQGDRLGDSPLPGRSEAPAPRPRGRPRGSISLTDELHAAIVDFVRAGVFEHVAAEAAGVSRRTFYEWMARGEGTHRTRPPTRRLRAFAQAVTQAHAQARLLAENRVYQDQPLQWLKYAARSRPDANGWTEPRARDPEPSAPIFEELLRQIDEQDQLAREHVGECIDPSCRSELHQPKGVD